MDAGELVARICYSSERFSKSDLLKIYEAFGGYARAVGKLSGSARELRNVLLIQEAFPVSEFLRVIRDAVTLGKTDAETLGMREDVVEDFDVFQYLWSLRADRLMVTIESQYVTMLVSDPAWESGWYSPAKGLSPVVKPVERRALESKVGDVLRTRFDAGVLELIHSTIMSESAYAREYYAKTPLVADDHWVLLATDLKRGVINQVVSNPLLPASVGELLVRKHKTASIREHVATFATDLDLLEEIWVGTKSESIRRVVSANPVWMASDRPSRFY